jgi:hypothetical protein
LSLASLGAPVRDIAAAAVPGGYVVAFITEPRSVVWGVPISSQLAPAYSAPVQTSPVDGNTSRYTSVSMHYDGTNLLAALGSDDTNTWFKTFTLDMNDYIVAENMPDSVFTPIVTSNATEGVTWWFDAFGHLFTTWLAADGSVAQHVDRGVLAATPDRVAGASGDAAVIVTQTGSDCVLEFTDGAAYGGNPLTSPCAEPQLLGGHGAMYWLTLERDSEVVAEPITISGPGATLGLVLPVGFGAHPLLLDTSPPTVVYRTSVGWSARTVDGGPTLDVVGAPNGDADAIEAAGPYAFAVFGTTLYAITCN